MNQGNAFSTYWAPVINLVRDPRWGRNLETSGEDPFHVGEYAIAWSKGFQTAPEDPFTLQASACCKHFVANGAALPACRRSSLPTLQLGPYEPAA